MAIVFSTKQEQRKILNGANFVINFKGIKMLDNSTFDYKPHLKSAYIDPIRTVTVIDDEYPTIDDLISPTKDSFLKTTFLD